MIVLIFVLIRRRLVSINSTFCPLAYVSHRACFKIFFELFANIKNVEVYFDVNISGESETEHDIEFDQGTNAKFNNNTFYYKFSTDSIMNIIIFDTV